MLRFLAPLVFLLSTVNSITDVHYQYFQPSAASSSQIKFAIENEYDDTGPGAKKPEYAYNTYRTLEDALVAYLDDPDTQLPEHEREKAIQKLLSKSKPELSLYQNQANYNKIIQNPYQNPYNYPSKVFFEGNGGVVKGVQSHFSNSQQNIAAPFKLQKFHTVKGNPISLAHYTRGFDQFDSFPKAAYYNNGDIKLSGETRNAGVVHGYYTYLDEHGKHRTVHYSGDDTKKTH